MTSTNGSSTHDGLDLDLDLDLDIDDIPIQIQDAQLSHLSPNHNNHDGSGSSVKDEGMESALEREHGMMDWQDIGSNGEDLEFDFNSAFPSDPSHNLMPNLNGIGLNIPPPSSNIPFSSPQLLQGPGFGSFPGGAGSGGQGQDEVRVKPEPQSPLQSANTPLSAGFLRTATPTPIPFNNTSAGPGPMPMTINMNMNMNMNGGFPSHHTQQFHPQSFIPPGTPMHMNPMQQHQPQQFFPPPPQANGGPFQQGLPLVDINGNLTVPSSALWPNSMSLPNPSNFPMPSVDAQLAPSSAAGNGAAKPPRRASVANPNTSTKSDSRPKKRPRTSRSRSASVKVQQAVAVSTPAGKNSNANSSSNTNTSPSADAGEGGSDSDSEGEMDVEMEMEEMLAEARDRASSCGSGQSLVNGFASGMGMSMTSNGGEEGGDNLGVKFKNKPFAPSKKKKVPPPGGFKPWNTSPASSHLPSGSACINPVTGEVELPPMDNLTKEEIRKVKNRASAQRSRTRKGELLGGLMDEVNRLRDRLKEVTGGREGGEDEIPDEIAKKRGFKSGTPSASFNGSAGDEEREGMKMLIERLRGEVERERKGRESAEKEVRDLKARLLGSVPVENQAMDDEDELVEIQPHLDAAALKPEAIVEKAADAGSKKKDRVVVKGTQRDSKGVLMMVVLFSFALFSIPPHLRAPGYHTSTAFQMHGNEMTSGLLGSLLPSEEPGKRQPMKGRKSLSFTLLKPINEEKPSEMEPSEDVEDVLEKWIGLSLFDEKQEEPEPAIPGGWVVVKSGRESPKESFGGESPKPPIAWDGTPLESMQLDDDIMSASLSHDQMDLLPFTPDNRQSHGPSPTLAPEFQGDPLAEEEARQRASSVPLVAPSKAGLRRQSMSVLGQGPSLTTSRAVSVPSALMASTSGRYMKLELEIDFEVEMTCKGIKRGADCVGIEEAGRLIDSGLTLGKDGNFLSLARS